MEATGVATAGANVIGSATTGVNVAGADALAFFLEFLEASYWLTVKEKTQNESKYFSKRKKKQKSFKFTTKVRVKHINNSNNFNQPISPTGETILIDRKSLSIISIYIFAQHFPKWVLAVELCRRLCHIVKYGP